MKTSCLYAALLGVLSFPLPATESSGGRFTLVTPGVSGGGGTSSGGAFALTGTVGQPDAGTVKGGDFVLQGGFYGVLVAPTVGGNATLTITLEAGSNAVLTWDQEGFTLEFRDALNAGADWQKVAPVPVGRSFITPASLPARFFRLRK